MANHGGGFFTPHITFTTYLVPLVVALTVDHGALPRWAVSAIGLVCGVILAVVTSEILVKSEERSYTDQLDRIEKYVNGKVQRYWLLFAVNGGAAIVAKYVLNPETSLPQLKIDQVAAGAIVFTILMTWDIWLWGFRMRDPKFVGKDAFTWAGRAIALTIGGLLIVGWRLAMS